MTTEPRPATLVRESLGALIDVVRYPIDKPNDPVRAGLVESCRRRLAETGCARLQAFINPEALLAMVGDGEGGYLVTTAASSSGTGTGVAMVKGDFNGDGRIDVVFVKGNVRETPQYHVMLNTTGD